MSMRPTPTMRTRLDQQSITSVQSLWLMQSLGLMRARKITKNIRNYSKMKFYSVDFRQKIINVYEIEPISQRQRAKRFCVPLSFVQKLLKQYRQTQDISPQTHRCGSQLKLTPEQLVILAQLIEANNDATLEELCELLYEKIGVTVSRATMGRMIQRLNMTFKKKRSVRQIKAVREFKTFDMSSGNK
jgi:transposase